MDSGSGAGADPVVADRTGNHDAGRGGQVPEAADRDGLLFGARQGQEEGVLGLEHVHRLADARVDPGRLQVGVSILAEGEADRLTPRLHPRLCNPSAERASARTSFGKHEPP